MWHHQQTERALLRALRHADCRTHRADRAAESTQTACAAPATATITTNRAGATTIAADRAGAAAITADRAGAAAITADRAGATTDAIGSLSALRQTEPQRRAPLRALWQTDGDGTSRTSAHASSATAGYATSDSASARASAVRFHRHPDRPGALSLH
jgi:hypothetical protein